MDEIIVTPPPKGPPGRTYKDFGFFGNRETKESVRAREDYTIYIKAYMEGLAAGRIQGRQFKDKECG